MRGPLRSNDVLSLELGSIFFNITNLLYLVVASGQRAEETSQGFRPCTSQNCHPCFPNHCNRGPNACLVGHFLGQWKVRGVYSVVA